MLPKPLFVFCFVLLLAGLVGAQNRTITNLDLEKYRQERLASEKDLRENYEKLGFPSPAELERRNAESLLAIEKLSSKLRAERHEQDRLNAQRAEAARFVPYYGTERVITESPNRLGFYWFNGRQYWRPQYTDRRRVQPGYYAGGQFWPTGPRTPSRPLIQILPR